VVSFYRQEVIGGPSVLTPAILGELRLNSRRKCSGVYLGLVSVQAVGDLHLYVSYAMSDGDAAFLKRTSAWMMLPRIA
jgi:hypothetical protein